MKNSTGYGQHGDYLFGWKGDSLQTAMDSGCYLRNCTQLTAQEPKVKNTCQVPVTAHENIDGCMFYLILLTISMFSKLTLGTARDWRASRGRSWAIKRL